MNQIRIGVTNGRGYDDFKPHLYIPITSLTKLTDKGSWSNSIEKYKYNTLPKGVCLLQKKISP